VKPKQPRHNQTETKKQPNPKKQKTTKPPRSGTEKTHNHTKEKPEGALVIVKMV